MHPECVVVVVFAAAAELFFRLLVASLMSIYYNLIGVDGGGLEWDAGMVMAGGAWVLMMVILNIFLTWWMAVDIIATEAAAAGAAKVKAAVVQRI